jgi:hypothetical protein
MRRGCCGKRFGNFISNGLLIGLVAAVLSVIVVGQARALVIKFFPSGTVPDELSDKFLRIVHINALVFPYREEWMARMSVARLASRRACGLEVFLVYSRA